MDFVTVMAAGSKTTTRVGGGEPAGATAQRTSAAVTLKMILIGSGSQSTRLQGLWNQRWKRIVNIVAICAEIIVTQAPTIVPITQLKRVSKRVSIESSLRSTPPSRSLT